MGITMWDQILVISSPKAGAGGSGVRLRLLQERLAEMGFTVTIETNLMTGIAQVQRSLQVGQTTLVVAAGGDGTLNLVAGRMPKGTAIMPFPLGTENLAARHYGIAVSAQQAVVQGVETVLRGRSVWIDAGRARFSRPGRQHPREQVFLVMASVGFDAEVVRRMHLTRTGHINRWSYAKPIWHALRTYHYPRIRVERATTTGWEAVEVETKGHSNPLTVAWAFVFNLPRYAAGLKIEPRAIESDGLLDFCGLEMGSHYQSLRYLTGVLTGRHHGWSDVQTCRGVEFRLSSDRPLAVQLDGDFVARLPVELSLEPQRVLLRLPNILDLERSESALEH